MSRTIERPATGPIPKAAARRPNSALITFYLALGGLSFAVLQSLVAPALPTIGQDLGAATGDVSWILTAYLLSASVLTPIFARLGDMVGKRRILIVVLSLLLVGTLLAALAPNLGVLIVARALQGAAGAIMPLSIGIVRDELPRREGQRHHRTAVRDLRNRRRRRHRGRRADRRAPVLALAVLAAAGAHRDCAARRHLRHARIPRPEAGPPRPARHRHPDRVARVAPSGHQRGTDLGLGLDRRPSACSSSALSRCSSSSSSSSA